MKKLIIAIATCMIFGMADAQDRRQMGGIYHAYPYASNADNLIDDTPEAVVLSSFDPLRREIARVTLENLLKDGRIHPTRIEELYDNYEKNEDTNIDSHEYLEDINIDEKNIDSIENDLYIDKNSI